MVMFVLASNECVMERSSFFSVYIRNFIYILRKLTSSITGVIKQIQILRKSGTPRPIIKLTSLENLSVPRSIQNKYRSS
jgi:hypothetical protein